MGAGLQKAFAAAKRTNYPGTPAPAVNQRWADKAPDLLGREVMILDLVTTTANVLVRKTGSYQNVEITKAKCQVYRSGVDQKRTTQINVERMIPTARGMQYVGEGPPAMMPGSGGSK